MMLNKSYVLVIFLNVIMSSILVAKMVRSSNHLTKQKYFLSEIKILPKFSGIFLHINILTHSINHPLTHYLNLLCIPVRDAAARLPNGEGTRGDICELLKDSQFLAPGVTEVQVTDVE